MSLLLDNLWIKIIALFFGLLLWLHVATEKIYTYQMNLPVSEVILQDGLVLTEAPPDSIMVTVLASGKQLMRKKWRDRGLKIIANQFGRGVNNMTLNTSNVLISFPSSDITLEEINMPSSITLNIDRLDEKNVPIETNFIMSTADGYAVGGFYKIKPDKIKVVGPEATIKNIDVIQTEQKELTDLRNSFELAVKLSNGGFYGVVLSPDSATYSVEVVPIKTRVFKNIPVAVYNLPPGLKLKLNPEVVEIELTGPPNEIDLVNQSALMASIDYNYRSADNKCQLKVDSPSKFKVKSVSPDSISFTVE